MVWEDDALREAPRKSQSMAGKVRGALLLFALGVPLPIVLLVWLLGGC
jgi:hypothetical protein